MAKSSTCDEFDSKEFLHFPDGIVCEICIRQTFWLSLRKKKGNKLMCDSCCRSSLSRVSRSTPVNLFFLNFHKSLWQKTKSSWKNLLS
jgi:hypothetical protein